MPDHVDYCELHAHSNFSFLDGASHPEELIGRAAQLGMPALAVTDHAGLYAAVRLWKAAQQTRTDAAREACLSPVNALIGLEAGHSPGRGRGAARPSRPQAQRSAARREGQPRLAGRAPCRPHPRRPPRPAGARCRGLLGPLAPGVARSPRRREAVSRLRAHAGGGGAGRGTRPPRRPLRLPQRRGAAPPAGRRAGCGAGGRGTLGQPLPGGRLRGGAEPPPAARRRLARGAAGRAGAGRPACPPW